MAGHEHVSNQVPGTNTGNVVQAGTINGGVHIHQSAPKSWPGDRQRLLAALRTMTVPVTVADAPRTAFTVAPNRQVTWGEDNLTFLDTPVSGYPCLAHAVEPADELWALGYPNGDEPAAEIIGLRCSGVLNEHSVAHPLDVLWGKPGVGSTGGPVINWRTGAVCGLAVISESGVWLVPATMIEQANPLSPAVNRAWLELLDDSQLRASGQRYPGARLRTYISDVSQIGEGHPYRPLVQQGPSLTEFYLPQHLHDESDGTRRISVDVLAHRHEGAQVLGDPGVGKSSLVRHLAAESAGRWLADGTGAFVPIPVSARALAVTGSLPRLLADGVTREITTVVDGPALIEMFEREPIPGVPWLVLVDGLDEVLNESDRRLVLGRVLNQRGRSVYRFLVTSRPLGSGAFNRLSKHAEFPTYVVEPFSDAELSAFALAWFLDAGHHDAEDMAGTFVAEVSRSGLGRLARVPLVSMMLCILFASDRNAGLPRSQFAVYERFFAVLIAKLEASGTRQQFKERVASFGTDAEQAVAQLVTGLPGLLEQIAVARQGVLPGTYPDTRPVLTQAVTRSSSGKPAVVPDQTWADLVGEALRASGLLVHRRDDFRFLHQTIEEYLAARHLAASTTRAMRSAVLRPQTTWPWHHLEIKIFVVALWTAKKIDLSPQFARLLKRRHRQGNVGFIAELARRGVPIPARIQAQACDVLVERLRSDRALFGTWRESVRWLHDIDPGLAISELERLVHAKAPQDRSVDAVWELAALDQQRGTSLAHWLLEVPGISPGNRVKLAKHLHGIDNRLGVEILTGLARRPDMGRFSVDAAILLADSGHGQGNELLSWIATTHESFEVCLAAVRTLAKRDPVAGAAALDRLSRDKAATPELRLELAYEIEQLDTEAALPRLAELAHDRGASSSVRQAAARRLSLLDPDQAVHALTVLAHDPEAEGDDRIQAATYLAVELRQGTDALVWLAQGRDPDLPSEHRIQAAINTADSDPRLAATLLLKVLEEDDLSRSERRLAMDSAARLDPERGVTVLMDFVCADETAVNDRLAGAETLLDIGHGADILPAIEEVAGDSRVPGQQRLSAAALIDQVDQVRGQDAYVEIATDDLELDRIRLDAAGEVRKRDEATALDLYVSICLTGDTSMNRIDAGIAAGDIDKATGITALADLLRYSPMSHRAERIARAMMDIDRTLAIKELRTLPQYAAASSTIRAARRRSY